MFETWRLARQEFLNLKENSKNEIDGYKLSCIPSPPDTRNYKFQALLPFLSSSNELPESFTSEHNLPKAFDQKNRGSCTSSALIWGLKAQHEIAQGDWPIEGLSVAYLYSRQKEIDGFPNEEGSTIHAGLKILQKYGACLEKTLKYENLTKLNPPAVCKVDATMDNEATKYRIGTYAQICNVSDKDRNEITIIAIKQAVYLNKVVPVAIVVCENFNNYSNTYMIPMPQGKFLGLHAIVIVGWDDKKRAFRIRNTWGDGWADKGYAWLPYDFVIKGMDWTGYGNVMWYLLEAWWASDVVVISDAKEIYLYPYNTRVVVDGVDYYTDQPPIVDSTTNRMLIPLRFVSNHMGRLVEWDGQKAIIRKIN